MHLSNMLLVCSATAFIWQTFYSHEANGLLDPIFFFGPFANCICPKSNEFLKIQGTEIVRFAEVNNTEDP